MGELVGIRRLPRGVLHGNLLGGQRALRVCRDPQLAPVHAVREQNRVRASSNSPRPRCTRCPVIGHARHVSGSKFFIRSRCHRVLVLGNVCHIFSEAWMEVPLLLHSLSPGHSILADLTAIWCKAFAECFFLLTWISPLDFRISKSKPLPQ